MPRGAGGRACALGVAALLGFARPAGAEPDAARGFELLGEVVGPGQRRELLLTTGESFAGFSVTTPVVVLRGTRSGPTLCLTGGIHGDEVNGIEIVRRTLQETEPQALSGTLIGVPIVNLLGFRRASRYLPDRRDLNRHFPGQADGSAASRIAHRLFDGVIRHCDALVDFHTGSFHRRNLSQVRADLSKPPVHRLALGFDTEVIVHTVGQPGTLRRAALETGIAAITYEAGEPTEFREEEVRRGIKGVLSLLSSLSMLESTIGARPERDVFYRSRWLRADDGGIFVASVGLGTQVRAGQPLGHVTDPVSNERSPLVASHPGRIIGMAVNQAVIPGFAVFHLGIQGGRPEEPPQPGNADASALDEPVELDERPE